jgi:hypothetical protein
MEDLENLSRPGVEALFDGTILSLDDESPSYLSFG